MDPLSPVSSVRLRLLCGLFILLAPALLAAAPAEAAQRDVTLAAPPTLVVMTYNLRYADTKRPHAWPDRRPAMVKRLREAAPDLVGTQEGIYPQIKDLAVDLPEYAWIGLGREGGSRGEFMAVFYRRSRFEPLEFDHFWLSDTPEQIASITWGHLHHRMVTWVRFRDLATGRVFVLLNTHFDHKVQEARERSATLIRARLSRFDPREPVIVTGDFNAPAGMNATHEILTRDGGLLDTWDTARERTGDPTLNTFTQFEAPKRESLRIDWILTTPGVQTDRVEIMNWTTEPQPPSDHLPVVAWLRLP